MLKMKIVPCILLSLLASPSNRPLADIDKHVCVCRFIAPIYSPVARHAGIEGTVRINLTVDAQGVPMEFKVLDEGHPLLREAGLNAAKGWRFCESQVQSDTREVVVTFIFKLEGTATEAWSPTQVSLVPPATVTIVTPSARTPQY
jgi:TonB family protein